MRRSVSPFPCDIKFLFYSLCRKYLQQQLKWNIPFIRQQLNLSEISLPNGLSPARTTPLSLSHQMC